MGGRGITPGPCPVERMGPVTAPHYREKSHFSQPLFEDGEENVAIFEPWRPLM